MNKLLVFFVVWMFSVVSSFQKISPLYSMRGGGIGCGGLFRRFCQQQWFPALEGRHLRPKVIFVLGGPGAGKGTQCEMLCAKFTSVKHLSAGELLRKELESGSPNGKLISNVLAEGKIVPVQITLDLLKNEIQKSTFNRFLIDGFPRNLDNLQGWDSCMDDICDLEAVFYLDCPEEVLEQRLLTRGKTSGRSDDNKETVKKRLLTFRQDTMPIVEHYREMGKLVTIPGNQTIERVFASAFHAFQGTINIKTKGIKL